MIACLCCFRDESRHLPGYLAHLRDSVDCFIGCDGSSVDDSGAYWTPGQAHTPAHPPRHRGRTINLEYNL